MADVDGGGRPDAVSAPAQHYASEFTVNITPADATLSFGRTLTLFSPEGEVLEGVRGKEWLLSVIMSPPTLKAAAEALRLAVEHYEALHGMIVGAQTPKSSIGAPKAKSLARK